jgi:murein peptide amidase A
MQILKKINSKNNNEIVLISRVGLLSRRHKTILIIGVVHGEEPQGKVLIENYLMSLRAKRSNPKNKLLFIPCLNPDGFAQNKRQNANGIDLNRNFPTLNWAKSSPDSEYFGGENSASEIETRFLIEILAEFSPDVILTIHAPYKVVNYDGPAEEIAQKISEIIGYPVSKDIGYPTPGSLGTYAGVERNIPTITLELNEGTAINDMQESFNQICDYLSNN